MSWQQLQMAGPPEGKCQHGSISSPPSALVGQADLQEFGAAVFTHEAVRATPAFCRETWLLVPPTIISLSLQSQRRIPAESHRWHQTLPPHLYTCKCHGPPLGTAQAPQTPEQFAPHTAIPGQAHTPGPWLILRTRCEHSLFQTVAQGAAVAAPQPLQKEKVF